MDASTLKPSGGELLSAISNLVVGVYADHIGRGPTKARTFVDNDIVVCVMEDTMTTAEKTLASSGRAATVIQIRANFHETMRKELVTGVEALTGRRVVAFIGGASLSPDIASELFVLDGRRDRAPSGSRLRSAEPDHLGSGWNS
jgi:uncharacterized protein YbcI